MGTWSQKIYKGHTDDTISKTKCFRTPIEAVTGETPDISEYVYFDSYDLVWHHTGKHPIVSKEYQSLGLWIRVECRVGSDMSYCIMQIFGQPIAEKKCATYHL